MNPLNSNPFGQQVVRQFGRPTNDLNSQLINNVRNVKSVMRMVNGDPRALVQKFPSLGPVLQMAQGQNLQSMFMTMCQEHGIDPNVILNELRS